MGDKEELSKPILIEDLGYLYPRSNSKQKKHFGRYKCGLCENIFKVQIQSINTGATKSCGCYSKQLTKERNTKHGLGYTRLYNTWTNMKDRVLNPKKENYINYGGRGITICDEWKNDVKSFYDWAISNGYLYGLSLDRIDNDGNYCPENCRWTTRIIQNRNQRMQKNNTSGYKGVSYYKRGGNYQTYVKIKYKKIHLGRFKTVEEGAIAYNNYIIKNNLEGFILNEIPQESFN